MRSAWSERRSFTILCLDAKTLDGGFGEVGDQWVCFGAASGELSGCEDNGAKS